MDFLRDSSDLRAAEQAAEVGDDVDMWLNAQGRLGMVAMRKGVHVCWQCFEPISQQTQSDASLRAVEVFPEGATNGVWLHSKCANYAVAPKVHLFARGNRVRRGIASLVKGTAEISRASAEAKELAKQENAVMQAFPDLSALGHAIRARK